MTRSISAARPSTSSRTCRISVDGRIHVVEIKSYPRIDGRPTPKGLGHRPSDRGLRPEPAGAHGRDRRIARRGQHQHDDRAAREPLLPADRGHHRHRHVRATAAAPTRSVPPAAEILDAIPRDPLPAPAKGPAPPNAAAAAAAREALAPLPPGSPTAASPAHCFATAATRRNSTAPPHDSVPPWQARAATSLTSGPRSSWRRAAAHRRTLPRPRSRPRSRGRAAAARLGRSGYRESTARPPGPAGRRRAASCRRRRLGATST